MASPLIVLVAADKGGVGKTTVARALLDYCAHQGTPARAFDTEPGEGVLRRFHPDAEALPVETVAGQMLLVDGATAAAITVVDCRAGMLTPIIKAFGRIRLMDDVKNGVLRLLVLHVVGPNTASQGEVAKVAEEFASASVVEVLNWTNPDAQFDVAGGGRHMSVPFLEQDAFQAVDIAGLPFAAFATDPRWSRVLRAYVRAWEDDVFRGFDAAGVGAMLKG